MTMTSTAPAAGHPPSGGSPGPCTAAPGCRLSLLL